MVTRLVAIEESELEDLSKAISAMRFHANNGEGFTESVKSNLLSIVYGLERLRDRAVDSGTDPYHWPSKTSEEIVTAGLEFARRVYMAHGYRVEEGYKFYEARHPQEKGMWNLAVIAFEDIAGVDLEEALANTEEDE